MKRSTITVWLLPAVLGVGLLLVFDPAGCQGGGYRGEAVSSSTEGQEAPAAAPEAELAKVAEIAVPPGVSPAGEAGRRELELAAESAPAVLRVIDPSGRPVAHARIVLARDGMILLDERTDSSGEVAPSADSLDAVLVVSIGSRPPELREIRLDAGLQEVHLSVNARVAGRLVREDGGPAEGLRLRLDSDQPLPSAADIPQVVWDVLGVPSRNRVVLWSSTDAEGEFEFSGLPWAWRGSLRIPSGWRVLSTTEGKLAPYARGVLLLNPAPEMVVRVERQDTLYGRLILRDDGEPLGGASLSARMRSPDADSPDFTLAETDEEGRFELTREHKRVSAFDLHLGGRFHEGSSILRLDGADLPPDGDLGEVVVSEVRNVPFVLRNPQDEPIAGGTADAAGTRSAPTGNDGRSTLPWLPRSVDWMRVEADGFVPAEVALPEIVAEALVVVLEPSNLLAVDLVAPLGGDPAQFKVVLRREEGVTEPPIEDAMEQRAHVGTWAYPPYDLMQVSPASYLAASPEPDGVATFRSLRSGVEIELEVRGITGEAVFHRRTLAPFDPTETRRIEVTFGDEVRVFRGRVLDSEENPLEFASLQLGNRILGRTNKEGAFLCFLLDEEPQTLLIQHEACSILFLHDYVAPADGRPVEFRLSPAHNVTIEVVDESGRPVPQAEVWIQQEGFTTNTHRIDGSRHVATSLTDNPFEIVTRLAGRVYTQEHSSVVPEARVVVPVHGAVVAVVSDATSAGREGRFLLALEPAEGDPALLLTESRASSPNRSAGLRIEIPAVHPGVYQASLHYTPSDVERAAGRAEETSDPIPVTVEAGEETEIQLDLTGGA